MSKTKSPPKYAPLCAWFARCSRPATGATKHSVLGYVFTCAKCAAFAGGEQVPLSQIDIQVIR